MTGKDVAVEVIQNALYEAELAQIDDRNFSVLISPLNYK